MRFFPLIVCLLISALGCQRAASLTQPRVTEQSRRERPAWVNTPSLGAAKSGETIAYHSVKTKVMDLPLGLKQAEAAALNDTRLQIQNEMVLFWKKDKAFADLEAADRALVTHRLEKLLETRITADLVRDIYYERIFDPNDTTALQETYGIHVLVEIKRPILQGLLADLRAYCRSSLNQGLIQLARNEQVFSTQP